jgi:uncharacterized phage-associated protein
MSVYNQRSHNANKFYKELCEKNPAFEKSDSQKILLPPGELKKLVYYIYTEGMKEGYSIRNENVFNRLRDIRAKTLDD